MGTRVPIFPVEWGPPLSSYIVRGPYEFSHAEVGGGITPPKIYPARRTIKSAIEFGFDSSCVSEV